jgi:REP element-mobilizing transposase RayT
MQNSIVLPHRKQLRLRGYDYAFPGVYFVTICSVRKLAVFGSVSGEKIVLSPAGEIVRSEWVALAERFAGLALDEFVIMPNHLHGVLGFVGQAGGASRGPTGGASPSPTTTNTTTKPGLASFDPKGGASRAGGASPSPTLFDVIGAFKSISTIKVNRLLRRRGVPLWQRSYYEHIVRTGEDLRKIQRYILENPFMWSLDPENPNRKSS